MAEYKKPLNQQDLEENFAQIHPDMDATMAYYESARCLFCYDAPCIQACPSGIDIPLFIRQISTENVIGAAKTIYDSNYFGQICGKVCPTAVLCEGACVYNESEVKPIQIGDLQSYACKVAIASNERLYEPEPPNGMRVAVIGAGPAGIACACELRLLGYEVDIFEAKEKPSGLALYGTAPYKITNEEVLREVEYLENQFDLHIYLNHPVTNREHLAALEAKYDAIFLGTGLGNIGAIGIPGEDLENCLDAIRYIEEVKINPLNALPGKKVVVIGGGNTAIDAAAESARLGAESVILAYRRSKEEMGAYAFEYQHAKEAGVKGLFNAQPVAVLGNGRVEGIRFVKTEIAGERKSREIQGTEFDLACDVVIFATGQQKRREFFGMIDGLALHDDGRIKVDKETFQTANPKYFSGGDAQNGGAEVVNAAAEGKGAAKGIHRWLSQ